MVPAIKEAVRAVRLDGAAQIAARALDLADATAVREMAAGPKNA
jgi:hypothetical protein